MSQAQLRAVLVEDSFEMADLVGELLQDMGFTTDTFTDARAVQGERLCKADLVLLDLQLGHGDGVSFMRQWREDLANAPILLLSASDWSTQSAAAEAGRRMGLNVTGFVQKPFSLPAFQTSVRAAMTPVLPRDLGPEVVTADECRALLTSKAIEVRFRPRHRLHSRSLIGFDAILSACLDDGRRVSGSALFAAAQNSGLAFDLQDLMLEAALEVLSEQDAEHELFASLWIPCSRLLDTRFPDQIARACDQASIPRGLVQLVIDENELVAQYDEIIIGIARLSIKGLRIAIDDFGSGLSVLSRLRSIPCEEIRLSEALTRDLGRSSQSEVLVGKCVELAHDLDRVVSARGIDSESTLERLRLMGCDHGEGAVFEPMDLSREEARRLTR